MMHENLIRRNLKEQKLTQQYLKDRLHYNPVTGLFTWKQQTNKKGSWNSKHAHKVAGYINNSGYIRITIDYDDFSAHRLAFLYMEGYFPENIVDHKDRVRNNNRWYNLRHVSDVCNNQNCGFRLDNKSGVTGVNLYKPTKKWHAQIQINKMKFGLGYYDKFIDAVWARYNEEQSNPLWTCSTNSSAEKCLIERGLL